ncbi:MAG: hypothetical protein U1F87_06605 [Kiritimatiellia bacterium]
MYLDDLEKPVAEVLLQDWFRGDKGPLIRLENLCAYSYLPVPYNKRLRIDVEVGKPGGRFYYQFNTARLPPAPRWRRSDSPSRRRPPRT